MALRLKHFGILLALAAGLNSSLTAQRYRQWLDPYQKGIQAFEAGNYAQAAGYFETAIQADDRPSPRKPTYGNFDHEYFPHLYLGMSLYHLDRFQEAQSRLAVSQSHDRLTGDKRQMLSRYLNLVSQALQSNPLFDRLVEDVQGHLDAQRFRQALQALDDAPDLQLDQQEQQRLGQLRNDAEEGRFSELVAEGNRLIEQGRLAEALQRFNAADQLRPGRSQVAQAIDRINQERQASVYDGLLQAGRTALGQSPPDLASALTSFRRALNEFPDRAAADKLKDRVELLVLERDCKQSFEADRLDQASQVCSRALRQGSTLDLVADYRGKADSQVLTAEARKAAQSGQMNEAVGFYRQALEADAGNQEARSELSQAERFQNRWQQADQLYDRGAGNGRQVDRQALRNARDIYRSLASSNFAYAPASSRFDDILRLIDGRLASDSNDVPTEVAETVDVSAKLRQALGDLYQGNVESAIRELEDARRLGGENVDVHAFLGVAYATAALLQADSGMNDYWDKAMREFEAALRLDQSYRLDEDWVSPVIRKAFQMQRAG